MSMNMTRRLREEGKLSRKEMYCTFEMEAYDLFDIVRESDPLPCAGFHVICFDDPNMVPHPLFLDSILQNDDFLVM